MITESALRDGFREFAQLDGQLRLIIPKKLGDQNGTGVSLDKSDLVGEPRRAARLLDGHAVKELDGRRLRPEVCADVPQRVEPIAVVHDAEQIGRASCRGGVTLSARAAAL